MSLNSNLVQSLIIVQACAFFILKLKSFNIYAFAVHCSYRYPQPVVGYENALNNIR